jgi:hypothetical protein
MGRAYSGRRDDFVEPYFKQAKSDKVVVILKAREPARIMIAPEPLYLKMGTSPTSQTWVHPSL